MTWKLRLYIFILLKDRLHLGLAARYPSHFRLVVNARTYLEQQQNAISDIKSNFFCRWTEIEVFNVDAGR